MRRSTMKARRTVRGYENAAQLQRLGIEPLQPPERQVASMAGQLAIPGIDLAAVEADRRGGSGRQRSAVAGGRQRMLWGEEG